MTVTLSHRGLCVADLAASRFFYQEVFGFTPIHQLEGVDGSWLDHAHGIPGCRIDVCGLRNAQGIRLNLISFAHPEPVGPRTRRPMYALGLTHLNFYVRDLHATLGDVHRYGGAVLDHTRLDTPDGISMIHCTDPDGIRVEVWTSEPYNAGGFATALPGIDRKFSHSGVCVSALERSLSFYAALGFHLAECFDYRDPPGQLDSMNEAEGTALLAQMTRNGQDVIELLQFDHPPAQGDGTPREANRIGLANLVFNVSSLDVAVDALQLAGGRVLADSRSAWDDQEQIQCLDPDGTRIELIAPLRSR